MALLNEEPGAQRVEELLPYAQMSAVNYSEVLVVAQRYGVSQQEFLSTAAFIPPLIVFDEVQALFAAALYEPTRKYGLSLGDRACLALAVTQNATAVTVDKVWKKLALGCEVEVIR